MDQKLFAVYLGGKASKANIELHDVQFVVGRKIEDTYFQLLEKWFGSVDGLHIDSWLELKVIDGHSITLSTTKPADEKKLYFINLGAYEKLKFSELHANAFLVAANEREVVVRAKQTLLVGMKAVHTDNLYDIDDCLEISQVENYYVHLVPTTEPEIFEPVNAYKIIPKSIVAEFKAQKDLTSR